MFEKNVTQYTLNYDAAKVSVDNMRAYYKDHYHQSPYHADAAMHFCDIIDRYITIAKECDDDINNFLVSAIAPIKRMPSYTALVKCIHPKIECMGLPSCVADRIKLWVKDYIQVVRETEVILPTNTPMAVLLRVVSYVALQTAYNKPRVISVAHMRTLMDENNLSKENMLTYLTK